MVLQEHWEQLLGKSSNCRVTARCGRNWITRDFKCLHALNPDDPASTFLFENFDSDLEYREITMPERRIFAEALWQSYPVSDVFGF